MIDHLLGRPSVKSRRLQVLAVLAFWSAYLIRGPKHGPPVLRFFSRFFSKRLSSWQTVVMTMMYLYAARNFSTLIGLASPDPLANMYEASYFRATWALTALDAGFWTAMKIQNRWLRDLASIVFSLFYMVAAEKADEKVRKVRSNITVEHLRVSWNKGNQSPYLRFLQGLVRPRFTRWPPRAVRIPRPSTSDYKEPVSAWLYYDGPLADLHHHTRVVLDIPGGGFVAMDPRCNDDKLFAWTAKTGLPVLSLDYKKAPEYPYPYALNECYDVYTTLIKSRGRCIGLSGREVPSVVVTGDSAGGTLATAMTLMIIESGSSPVRRFQGQTDLPVPDGLILFYPALDMNIGSWMSDEQMTLIQDRQTRGTNKPIIQRKTNQYNDLVGTPHQSDDEDDSAPSSKTRVSSTDGEADLANAPHVRSPAPEYAHPGPSNWCQTQQLAPSEPSNTTSAAASTTPFTSLSSPSGSPTPATPTRPNATGSSKPSESKRQQSASHHPQPMRTRLAVSSMISYFNDRVLTPEMMRAMIILYVGPHNRPDFASDYLLCPILAPDVLLARFPKTYFLTGERDPLVDDTVIFAGRLRRVKKAAYAAAQVEAARKHTPPPPPFSEKDVVEVALIPGISHGFLQFPTVYPRAWKLIDKIAVWIEDVLTDAERKAQMAEYRAQRSRRENGITERGHMRAMSAESSGDDDERPLEMSMTRMRGRSLRAENSSKQNGSAVNGAASGGDGPDLSNGSGAKMNGTGSVSGTPEVVVTAGDEDAGGGSSGNGNGGNGAAARKKKKGRRVRTREGENSLVKLASSDDLLGRRMEGLTSGLTGLNADLE